MKQLASTFFVFLLVFTAGCSSSEKSSTSNANSPLVGAWAMQDGSTGGLQFTPAGEVVIEQGAMMTAINRFQNTDRSRYNTRLSNTATYNFNGTDELVLNVMADWVGKGTGARRADDKSVASAIVFSVEDMGDTLKLTKVGMTQSGSETDNTNADEALSFTLKKM